MHVPKLTDIVNANNIVLFSHYADEQLWYHVVDGSGLYEASHPSCAIYPPNQAFAYRDIGFEFPVPIGDTGGATFLARDKSVLFMRWIRKHLETLTEWAAEAEKANSNDSL